MLRGVILRRRMNGRQRRLRGECLFRSMEFGVFRRLRIDLYFLFKLRVKKLGYLQGSGDGGYLHMERPLSRRVDMSTCRAAITPIKHDYRTIPGL